MWTCGYTSTEWREAEWSGASFGGALTAISTSTSSVGLLEFSRGQEDGNSSFLGLPRAMLAGTAVVSGFLEFSRTVSSFLWLSRVFLGVSGFLARSLVFRCFIGFSRVVLVVSSVQWLWSRRFKCPRDTGSIILSVQWLWKSHFERTGALDDTVWASRGSGAAVPSAQSDSCAVNADVFERPSAKAPNELQSHSRTPRLDQNYLYIYIYIYIYTYIHTYIYIYYYTSGPHGK